ncbi:MAG: porin family protein [Calditrichaeota bacterium]|nr:MAG: porin family protein [Calditrichota bacterium]
MKKFVMAVCILLIAGSVSAQSGSPQFGLGLNVGMVYPIVQDDQDNGSVIGFKVMYGFSNFIALEPNMSFVKYGDPSISDYPGLFDGLEGSKITSYGVDAVLGGSFGAGGINPYGIFGVGFYNSKRDQTDQDVTDFGWAGGFGIEIGFNSQFALDVRGKVNVVPSDGGGSKKSAAASAGLNFYLGSK